MADPAEPRSADLSSGEVAGSCGNLRIDPRQSRESNVVIFPPRGRFADNPNVAATSTEGTPVTSPAAAAFDSEVRMRPRMAKKKSAERTPEASVLRASAVPARGSATVAVLTGKQLLDGDYLRTLTPDELHERIHGRRQRLALAKIDNPKIILEAIAELGWKPQELRRGVNGAKEAKRTIRNQVGARLPLGAFDKAWRVLTEQGLIPKQTR